MIGGQSLTYYNAAKSALAQVVRVDQVKDIKDKAEAIRLYAQQQNDNELERYAALIKTRAMRRLGELSAELETGKAVGRGQVLPAGGKYKSDVLVEAGISSSTAHRCEKLAAMPVEKFEAAVEKGETSTQILKSLNVHVSNNSGENEWYTPSGIIEAARQAMGSIDLDPASSDRANKIVRATKFYTLDDDGLQHEWHGNIWLNPPYSSELIKAFSAKTVSGIKPQPNVRQRG